MIPRIETWRPKALPDSVLISLKIQRDLKDEAARAAKRCNVSTSGFIRQAVAEKIKDVLRDDG